jgi:hypothetical protein
VTRLKAVLRKKVTISSSQWQPGYSQVFVVCLMKAYIQKALLSRGFSYSPRRWQFCDNNFETMKFGV